MDTRKNVSNVIHPVLFIEICSLKKPILMGHPYISSAASEFYRNLKIFYWNLERFQCMDLDFNVWIDDLTNSDARWFCQFLDNFSLKNYLDSTTYDFGHTLDLVIYDSSSEAFRDIFIEPVCTILDHRLTSFKLKHKKIITFRKYSNPIFTSFVTIWFVIL